MPRKKLKSQKNKTIKINEDTEYEKATQLIYQTILDAKEKYGVINVKHNISPIGKSNCEHQIDVYYEIQGKNGINKVAIECKRFNTSKVKIGHVRNFWAAIHDLGFDKGIMVTKNQYQKGAKKYADYYGIDLMIMKEFDASNLISESEFPLVFTGFIESIDAKSTKFIPAGV